MLQQQQQEWDKLELGRSGGSMHALPPLEAQQQQQRRRELGRRGAHSADSGGQPPETPPAAAAAAAGLEGGGDLWSDPGESRPSGPNFFFSGPYDPTTLLIMNGSWLLPAGAAPHEGPPPAGPCKLASRQPRLRSSSAVLLQYRCSTDAVPLQYSCSAVLLPSWRGKQIPSAPPPPAGVGSVGPSAAKKKRGALHKLAKMLRTGSGGSASKPGGPAPAPGRPGRASEDGGGAGGPEAEARALGVAGWEGAPAAQRCGAAAGGGQRGGGSAGDGVM